MYMYMAMVMEMQMVMGRVGQSKGVCQLCIFFPVCCFVCLSICRWCSALRARILFGHRFGLSASVSFLSTDAWLFHLICVMQIDFLFCRLLCVFCWVVYGKVATFLIGLCATAELMIALESKFPKSLVYVCRQKCVDACVGTTKGRKSQCPNVQLHIQMLPIESISHKRQLPYFLQIASAQFYGFI